MNKLSMVIPKLKFSINIHNPNPTKYCFSKPKTNILSGHKNTQLYSRKMSNEINKTDIFVTQNVNIQHNNIANSKVKTPRKPHGKYSKEALAKYFDNDNPKLDYMIDLEIMDEKALDAYNQSLREVKDAKSIRAFVERNPKIMRNEAHGFDHNLLMQEYINQTNNK